MTLLERVGRSCQRTQRARAPFRPNPRISTLPERLIEADRYNGCASVAAPAHPAVPATPLSLGASLGSKAVHLCGEWPYKMGSTGRESRGNRLKLGRFPTRRKGFPRLAVELHSVATTAVRR